MQYYFSRENIYLELVYRKGEKHSIFSPTWVKTHPFRIHESRTYFMVMDVLITSLWLCKDFLHLSNEKDSEFVEHILIRICYYLQITFSLK